MVRGWQSTPKQNGHLTSVGILWTGKMGENGQSFSRDSKVPWDQTVGSKIPLIFGSLSTGSPVGLVGLTPTGLNVQSGHCNSNSNCARAVLMWSGGLKIETWEAWEDVLSDILEWYPAQAALLMFYNKGWVRFPAIDEKVELGFLPMRRGGRIQAERKREK